MNTELASRPLDDLWPVKEAARHPSLRQRVFAELPTTGYAAVLFDDEQGVLESPWVVLCAFDSDKTPDQNAEALRHGRELYMTASVSSCSRRCT